MRYLYVCEQGSVVGTTNGRIEVRNSGMILKSVPEQLVDAIALYGNIQMTAQCITKCLQTGIHVIYYSMNGTYYGRLIAPNHVDVELQRMQANLEHQEMFRLELSKRIIAAKIQNQTVLLRKNRNNCTHEIDRTIALMKQMKKKVEATTDCNQLLGYEGIAARLYFQELGKLVPQEFAFQRRSKRPPKDPYNALISLGYSMITNELYGKIESRGLNPYFGILHKDKKKHPSLVSDLVEEWRPVLVDSVALSMIKSQELVLEDFITEEDGNGIILSKHAITRFVKKIEEKMRTTSQYLSYINQEVSYREAMDHQIDCLVNAMESETAEEYHPVVIR